MPLKFTVDSLDTLPEAVRPLYSEKDGKFVLQLDGYEDPAGLKSALQKERADRAAAEKQARVWAGLGKTPEEIQALLEAQQSEEIKKAEKNGEWDKLRQQMNDKHTTELTAKDQRIAALTRNLEQQLVDTDAVTAIAAAKGVPELLLPHVRARVRVVEEDGKFVAQVVDERGTPRVDGKGAPLLIKDLVDEMRQSDVYGRAFDATGAAGSGSGAGNTSGGARPGNAEIMKLSPVERMNAARANPKR